jgi:DNA-directed RNA polymerase subunit RPC12/RpoP
MAIAFHCEHCGKKIEAPDNAGGKWGRCPACRNKVYVPAAEADDELKLAPLDTSDLEEQKRLLAETRRIEQEIMKEQKEVLDDSPERAVPVYGLSDKELTKNIIIYLRMMADGDLQDAERAANAVIPCGKRAIKILDGIVVSEVPEPELADIPKQVLSGLIKTLRSRIK